MIEMASTDMASLFCGLVSRLFRSQRGSIERFYTTRVSSQQGAAGGDKGEKKKKESIIDLSKYLDKPIRVKFSGGREVSGTLKGFDPLHNLVLDNTTEYLRDPDDPYKLTEDTREIGLVVCRGTSVVLTCPAEGMEAIPNPFVQQDV